MRPPIDNAVTVVTGASSGIGQELARQLAARVGTLVLVARRQQRLAELASELRSAHPGLQVEVRACDLTDRDALTTLCDDILTAHGAVDVLVNNAGFGDIGMFDLASWNKLERMLELNVRAVTYLTARFVPGMVDKGSGGVLNVSSSAGMAFLPGFAAYVGTKHYVTSFSESLRLDLRPLGVVVTQLCPGPVATEFEERAGNFVTRRPQAFVEIDASRCARSALRAFERGRAMVVPGIAIKLLMGLAAIAPRWMQRLFYAPIAKWLRRRQLQLLGEAEKA